MRRHSRGELRDDLEQLGLSEDIKDSLKEENAQEGLIKNNELNENIVDESKKFDAEAPTICSFLF